MRRSLLLLGLCVATASGCAPSPLEVRPLDVSLAASRTTAAPGDTVTFVVNAQGGSLLAVQIDYGDTNAAQFGTGGATTARVTFRHAYSEKGTYQVRAIAVDASAGQKEATLQVQVN